MTTRVWTNAPPRIALFPHPIEYDFCNVYQLHSDGRTRPNTRMQLWKFLLMNKLLKLRGRIGPGDPRFDRLRTRATGQPAFTELQEGEFFVRPAMLGHSTRLNRCLRPRKKPPTLASPSSRCIPGPGTLSRMNQPWCGPQRFERDDPAKVKDKMASTTCRAGRSQLRRRLSSTKGHPDEEWRKDF